MTQRLYEKISVHTLREFGGIEGLFDEAPPEMDHSNIDHEAIASSLLPLLYAGLYEHAKYIDDFVELQRYAEPLLAFQEVSEFEDPKESPAFVVREVYQMYIARQEARERQEKNCEKAIRIFDNINAAEEEINNITKRYFPKSGASRRSAPLSSVFEMVRERNTVSAAYATN